MKRIHRVLNPTTPPGIAGNVCALAVMTKAPRAGDVKTRLVPPLTQDEAAQANSAFLRDIADAIHDVVGCSGRPVSDMTPVCQTSQRRASHREATTAIALGVGVYTPPGAEAAYENILPEEFFLIPQRGDHFGDRLIFAAEDLFKVGFASVCLINSDSPTVPTESFAQAVKLLRLPGDRIVLGPCDDGGYYLIGLKSLHHELFEQIDWSTERVFEQTRQRAGEIDVEVKLLPVGYDVDDRVTLRRLCGELLGENSRDSLARNTRKFVTEIIEREGRDRIWPV
jgi:rSAM/selenodomain-associated transferase 1